MQNLIKTVIALVLPFSMFGQINYLKHYSDGGADFGYGIVQLEDSSYVMCGASSSFSNGPSQAFMMKVDSLGNFKWSQNYGGIESDGAQRIMYIPNEGFFLAGYTNSMGVGAFDFYLIKTDLSGNLEWEKTYGTDGWEKVNDAALTSDNGLIMVGETNSNLETGQDMYIVRTDFVGDTLWTKTIGGTGNDWLSSIERFQDSLYIVAGNKYVQDSLKSKVNYFLIHEDGTLIDERLMLNTGHWEINDITLATDTVQGCGSYLDTAGSYWKLAHYSLKVSPTGFSGLGQYKESNTGDFHGRHMTTYGSSSYRYYSMEHSNHVNAYPIGADIMVTRYSSVLSWTNQVSQVAEPLNDASGQIIPTSDGGAALVGSREGVGIGGGTMFLLKIGPDEVYPTVVGVTSYSQVVTIDELESTVEASLYPNPASHSFTIELEENSIHEVQLLNALGQVVQTSQIFGTETIDVSTLNVGFYTVLIRDGSNNLGAYRLIVQ